MLDEDEDEGDAGREEGGEDVVSIVRPESKNVEGRPRPGVGSEGARAATHGRRGGGSSVPDVSSGTTADM